MTLVWALLACRPEPTPTEPDSPASAAEALRQGLPGFEVTEGVTRWTNASACDVGDCVGNNPLSPYAVFGFEEEAEIPTYRLDPDEAMLIVGRTPPSGRYFSFGQYIHFRHRADGARLDVRGSISPFLNQHTLSEPDLFDAPVAVVASVQLSTHEAVVAALSDVLAHDGLTVDDVNALPIPWLSELSLADLSEDPAYADDVLVPFRPGHETLSDVYSATLRVAVPDDPTAAYFLEESFAVFRIRVLDPPSPTAWPYPHLPPESDVGHQRVDAVADAVSLTADHIEDGALSIGLETTRGPLEAYRKHGFACIAAAERCAGNNDDTRYWISPNFGLQQPSGASVVVVGAITPAVAASFPDAPEVAYQSLTAKNASTQVGIEAFVDSDLEGSFAARFPQGVAGVDPAVGALLYVVTVSRDCEGQPFCVEVPFTGPLGAAATDRLGLSERSTLNPISRTAPAADAVVVPIGVAFGPDVRRVDGVWLLD